MSIRRVPRAVRTAVSGVAAWCLLVATPALVLVSSTTTAGAARAPEVRISEVANGGPGGGADEFIEIANFGDEPVDLDGWGIFTCGTSAGRNGNPVVPLLSGVTLAAGESYLVAHSSSTLVDIADETDRKSVV